MFNSLAATLVIATSRFDIDGAFEASQTIFDFRFGSSSGQPVFLIFESNSLRPGSLAPLFRPNRVYYLYRSAALLVIYSDRSEEGIHGALRRTPESKTLGNQSVRQQVNPFRRQ